MKIAALDIGDVWIGVALSDPLGIIAKPYTTFQNKTFIQEISQLFKTEKIAEVVVGYPKTMRGTHSEQTEKVIHTFEKLKQLFPEKKWVLFDERLTSKQAEDIKRSITKEEKIKSHARAAAVFLQNYLHARAFNSQETQ